MKTKGNIENANREILYGLTHPTANLRKRTALKLFTPGQKLCKIFIINTLKLRYFYILKLNARSAGHNKKILKKKPIPKAKTCKF